MKAMLLAVILTLLVCTGCATYPMKLCNKSENYCAKQAIAALEAGDTARVKFCLNWLLRLTGAELATYGSVPEEINDSVLPIAEHKVYHDNTFRLGQMFMGAVGGYLGLSGTQTAVGGGILLSLFGVAAAFAKKWLNQKKETEVAKQRVEESEKAQYAQASAIELGANRNPALGRDMKDEVRSQLLTGTPQDKIVQQAVADFNAAKGERILIAEIADSPNK